MKFEDYTQNEISVYKKIYFLYGMKWGWNQSIWNVDYSLVDQQIQEELSLDQYNSMRSQNLVESYSKYISPIATWNNDYYTFTPEFVEWIGDNHVENI